MAKVETIQIYNVQTGEKSTEFLVSLEQGPSFTSKEVAERVATEINEVLKRFGG